MRSHRNGKDNAKVKYCRLIASRSVGNGSSQHNHKVNKIYNKTKINLQI